MFAQVSNALTTVFYPLMAGLPKEAWPLPLVVLLILGGCAAFDARTGRLPDAPLFFGMLLTVGVYGFFTDWPRAAHHLTLGLVALFALWGLNHLYYLATKRDSFGMGDAKWTMLLVTAFGPLPAVYAWVVGAWAGLLWMALRWPIFRFILRRPAPIAVHFGPFLFAGLLAGLWWTYWR